MNEGYILIALLINIHILPYLHKRNLSILTRSENNTILLVLLDRLPHLILRESTARDTSSNIRHIETVPVGRLVHLFHNLPDLSRLGRISMRRAGMVVERRFGSFDEAQGFVYVANLDGGTEVQSGDGLGHTDYGEQGTRGRMRELSTVNTN
jgi:hypothetical protein